MKISCKAVKNRVQFRQKRWRKTVPRKKCKKPGFIKVFSVKTTNFAQERGSLNAHAHNTCKKGEG